MCILLISCICRVFDKTHHSCGCEKHPTLHNFGHIPGGGGTGDDSIIKCYEVSLKRYRFEPMGFLLRQRYDISSITPSKMMRSSTSPPLQYSSTKYLTPSGWCLERSNERLRGFFIPRLTTSPWPLLPQKTIGQPTAVPFSWAQVQVVVIFKGFLSETDNQGPKAPASNFRTKKTQTQIHNMVTWFTRSYLKKKKKKQPSFKEFDDIWMIQCLHDRNLLHHSSNFSSTWNHRANTDAPSSRAPSSIPLIRQILWFLGG